ncbi:MAG: acyltransferase family protein [Acidimicrobiales bacterium]
MLARGRKGQVQSIGLTYSTADGQLRRGTETPGSGPERSDGRVLPLDGIRGVAILAIMAFHSGLPGIDVGGFFSQDAFFVLSGMVITLILLQEWNRTGAVRLGRFYAGRIRRLLPALLLMLICVTLYVNFVAPPGQYPGFRGDALAVLGYFSNWHFIATGTNYFALSAAPSLLTHTWSLAIEEQFYLVWPLILIAIMSLTRRRRTLGLGMILGVSLGGALLSTAWMADLYRAGATQTRLYYGTDTHAQSILVGCALATILTMVKLRRGTDALVPVARSRSSRWTMSLGGIAAALGLAWLWTHTGSSTPFAYEGGFLVGALLTALVLASAACAPAGPLAVALSARVLTYLGTISYGMYLWYFPIFQYVDAARTDQTGLRLFAVRVGIDVVIATLSYYLVELPVRRRALFRFASPQWVPRARTLGLLALSIVATLGVVVGTTAGSSVSFGVPVVAASVSPSHGGPGATRLLITGDSTALTLGTALPQQGAGWNTTIDEQGTIGCGVAIGPLIVDHGIFERPGAPCDSATPVDQQWPARLRRLVASDRPNIVALLAGRWEVMDRAYEGRWTNILDPAFQRYVRAQLRLAVQIGTAAGAHMVLLTAPCYSSGEQPDGSPWPEDSPGRIKAYNAQVTAVAAEFPLQVSVVNLNAMICPGGTFQSTIDGVTVRAPDGIHFPYFHFGDPQAAAPDTLVQVDAFAKWIGPRLMPSLVAGEKTFSD